MKTSSIHRIVVIRVNEKVQVRLKRRIQGLKAKKNKAGTRRGRILDLNEKQNTSHLTGLIKSRRCNFLKQRVFQTLRLLKRFRKKGLLPLFGLERH